MDADTDAGSSLEARLVGKLETYEARYGIASADLRTALANGQLADTLDTCDWLIAWEALDAFGRDGPARLE